jgi:hypothetical protein
VNSLTDEEKVGTRPLPSNVAAAIEASLDELQRLTEAAGEPDPSNPEVISIEIPVGQKQPDFVTRSSGASDVAVVWVGELKAVTRTERRDDQYHLDVNVSLAGLDKYEVSAVKRLFTLHLRSVVAAARQENSEARITQLLRAVAPPDPLADLELKIAEDTADLRREFLERVPVSTSAEVHQRAAFPGNNPSQTVHRWRKQGKIFSINYGGRDLYPSFQFGDDGRPLSLVAELLEILARDKDRSDWDNALWFAADSGWLDGQAPIDLLQSEPDLVKRAAEQEVLRDEP